MITTLYIGEWRVDQFKDESVDLVSSVLDIKDITKNTNSYTKTFTVPASARNNILFKHWYDFNIDDGFDSRTKIDGRIEIDYLPFKTGKFRLEKANLKKGKVESYTINFFGNLVDLKKLAGKKELSDLNLTAYDHTYDSDTVLTGLTAGLSSGDIIYNLFVKKQYYINSNGTDNTQTENLANISYDGGADAGVTWNDLRPSIRVIRLIEAIETLIGVTFSRHFFATTQFTGLFMWLNSNIEKEGIGNSDVIDWDSGDNQWINHTTNIGSYPVSNTGGVRVKFDLYTNIYPEPGYSTIPYTIRLYVDGEVAWETNWTGIHVQTYFYRLQSDTTKTYTVYWEISSEQEFAFTAVVRQKYYPSAGGSPIYDTNASAQTLASIFTLVDNIPKLKIIDFLKGLFTMYKLVIIPLDDGTLYVNTLEGYYAEGVTYDITKYCELDSYDVERGTIYNEISFKFSEPQTIRNIQYESNNGRAYGDEELLLYSDPGETELLDGESFTVELPFEQFVYERLYDQVDDLPSNCQYAAILDEGLSGVNPKPHLFYNARIGLGTKRIGFIDDVGVKNLIQLPINTPLHGNTFTGSVFSTTFSAERNEWDNIILDKNLYTNHYASLVEAAFNIKKRTTKIKANLPVWMRTKLGLNDVLLFKGNYYRPEKEAYNLLDGKTSFELVNSFDNTINPFFALSDSIYTDYFASEEIIPITNSQGSTINKVDTGYGVTWITAVIGSTAATNNMLELYIAKNTSGRERDMYIDVTQPTTGNLITFYVFQGLGTVTFDSDILTFDSDIVTFDKN